VTLAPVEADFPWYLGPSPDGLHEDEANVGGGVATEKWIESADGEGGASSHAGTGFRRIECVEDLVAVLDTDERGLCPPARARSRRPSSSAGSAHDDARVCTPWLAR
jgi:hypothetical protein